MKILLLDMDDVLLKPEGYHRALQETVRLVAACLGYSSVNLSEADIRAFEASGVYSEWDTAAICAALLLENAWKLDPSIHLLQHANQQTAAAHSLAPPDFRHFARLLGKPELLPLRPLERAERLLLSHGNTYSADQQDQLRHILRSARSAEGSLTHCTFQELVLGSQVYTQVYALPAVLNTPSYLTLYDRPLITPKCAQELIRWLDHPGRRAAIFTSRPSQPLPGVFSTPEAELGAKLVGLEKIPILGLGGLLWLSKQRQAGPQAFVKPSTVHVLSALLLSQGNPLETCLVEAARLALDGTLSPIWKPLQGAWVAVLDDSPAGLESARSAAEHLHAAGIALEMRLYGVAGNFDKAAALRNLGAETLTAVTTALERILGMDS